MQGLYRGKGLINGIWVFGYFVKNETNGNCYIYVPSNPGGATPVLVDPSTVGQFSGYKNFYKGDIVYGFDNYFEVCHGNTVIKKVSPNGSINEVEISCFYLKDNEGNVLFPIVDNYEGKHDLDGLEVVDNIHDNPNLIAKEVNDRAKSDRENSN
jgi:hypothetical protein